MNKIVKHQILSAFDCLALALVEMGHQWTQAERRRYEMAVRLLS